MDYRSQEILETYAAEMRCNQLTYSIYGGNYVLVIPKQLREHIQDAGWTKTDIAEFVFERARASSGASGLASARVRWCDRASKVHPALAVARRSVGSGRWRSCRRLRGHHRTLDGQQDESRDGRNRRLRRL